MQYTKYIEKRISLLKELGKKMLERSRINKQIRNIQSEMNSWDRALIKEED